MRSKKDKTNYKKARKGIVLLSLMLMALSTGCLDPKETPVSKNYYEVDPLFREIYMHLGGEQVLGPAISPVTQQGNITVQYMETCKMMHDPEAPLIQRF